MQIKYTDALEQLVYFEKTSIFECRFWAHMRVLGAACYDFYQMQKNFLRCNFWRPMSFLPASSEYVRKSAKSRNCECVHLSTDWDLTLLIAEEVDQMTFQPNLFCDSVDSSWVHFSGEVVYSCIYVMLLTSNSDTW